MKEKNRTTQEERTRKATKRERRNELGNSKVASHSLYATIAYRDLGCATVTL